MKKYLFVTIPVIVICIAAGVFLTQADFGSIKDMKDDEKYNAYYIQDEYLNSEFFVYGKEEVDGYITGFIQGENCNEDMSEYISFYHKDILPCSCFTLTLPKIRWDALTKDKPYFKSSLYVTEVFVEVDGRYYGFSFADIEKTKPNKMIKRAISDVSSGSVSVDNYVDMTSEEVKMYMEKYGFEKG